MSNTTAPFLPIDGVSRRFVLRNIAVAVTAVAGGQLTLEAARQVHQHAKEEKRKTGTYKPKLFKEQEFETVARLAELIVPADEVSGSARDAGAAEFIDLLCSQNEELAGIYTGGLLWLNAWMQNRYSLPFLKAKEEQQIALLDLLLQAEGEEQEGSTAGRTHANSDFYKEFSSYGIATRSDLGPGRVFFDWVRKMTVDAFYTSEIGITDIGYQGNGVRVRFEVPQDIIDSALKKSPFGLP